MSGPLPTSPPVPVDFRAEALRRIYDLLVLVVAATAVILAIWLLGEVLMVVFAATLLAVILHGTATLLSRLSRLPHWASLTIVVLLIVGLLVGLGFVAGPGLADQATALRQALVTQLGVLHQRLSATSWGQTVLDQLPPSLGGSKDTGMTDVPMGFAGSVANFLGSAAGLFGTITVVAITALYLAATPDVYVNGGLRLVPERHRRRARDFCLIAGHTLWAWSAGQALDMLVVGLLSGLGLWAIGVPLALVLGVVAGLLNFVPYIGAIVGALPAALIAFSVGGRQGLETIALYVVIQSIEGNVMAPIIQKRAVDMPPGVTILSQTVFSALLGFPGLIFATPLTAAVLAVMGKATAPLRPEQEVGIDRPAA